jgi:predicted nucleic acid-binding protein
MRAINIFLDSSALLAGIVSSKGASRAILLLGEDQKIKLIISEQVIVEVERNLARKAPQALIFAREMIIRANLEIVRQPSPEDVRQHLDWIRHPADVPIFLAAYRARVDFLATLNTRHFLDDPEVARKSWLRRGTTGDVLAWVRGRLVSSEGEG